MLIHEEFEVGATAADVWAQFQDIPSISRCLPGAELDEALAPDRWAGRLSIRLGPISAGFAGEATVTPDPATRSATIEGQGRDPRGGSRGAVTVRYRIEDAPDERARVILDAEVTLAGPIAQFGRVGLVTEVARRLIAQFASCLEAKLSAGTASDAAAIGAGQLAAGSLLLGSLGASVKRGLGGGRDRSGEGR